MAETVHLFLQANGVDIPGDSSQSSLGREASIECIWVEHRIETSLDPSAGGASKRRHSPIRIRKRVDRSSALLVKALVEGQVVQGVFKCFRHDPSGDGTTQHFFTIAIEDGRISDYRFFVPDTMASGTQDLPALEEVSFVFGSITWTYEPTGVAHTDTWRR